MNKVAKISVLVILLVFIYIVVNLIMYGQIIIPLMNVNNDKIFKKAVTLKEIKDRDYIICKWTRVTGFNYKLLEDENGEKTNDYCFVTGLNPEDELKYEVLTSYNTYILNVVEKKQYYSVIIDDILTEYVVDGWDILYPVRRETLFNTAPKYILESDYLDS